MHVLHQLLDVAQCVPLLLRRPLIDATVEELLTSPLVGQGHSCDAFDYISETKPFFAIKEVVRVSNITIKAQIGIHAIFARVLCQLGISQ